jgi:hypothetical protein
VTNIRIQSHKHFTLAFTEDRLAAVKWEANGATFVAAAEQEPERFDDPQQGTKAFMVAAGLPQGA